MKTIVYSILVALAMTALSSCEERSGYLDEGQESRVSLLTGAEWLLAYADYGYGYEETYESDTQIYTFDRTGKGYFARGSFTDPDLKNNISYYQWTFTTENFVVIYMSGALVESYWLIKKLTPDELWVQCTVQDPVLYPNQDYDVYRFKARK